MTTQLGETLATGVDTNTNSQANQLDTNLHAPTNGGDAYTNAQATCEHRYTKPHGRGDAYTNTKAKEEVAKAHTQATKGNMNTNASSPPGTTVIIQYETPIGRCLRGLCRTIVAMMTMVGMGIAVTLYCLFGAWLFLKLEGPHEGGVKESVDNITERICKEMQKLAPDGKNTEDVCPDNFRALLIAFKDNITWNITNPQFDQNGDPKWTFESSLLFAVTVVTTIGYGHIAPVTYKGRVATIIFGVYGIPLTLICLANIADYMAKWFRWMYRTACTCFKERFDKHGVTQVPLWLCGSVLATYLVLGAWLFNVWEEWTYIDSLYFCLTTLATIGFGDLVPGFSGNTEGSVKKKVSCVFYLVIGLTFVAMCFELMGATANDMADRCFGWLGIQRQKRETEKERKMRLAAREKVNELFTRGDIGESIVSVASKGDRFSEDSHDLNVETNIKESIGRPEAGNATPETDTDTGNSENAPYAINFIDSTEITDWKFIEDIGADERSSDKALMQNINIREKKQAKSQPSVGKRCLKFVRRFTVFFMSTTGLAIFVALYCMIGAWIFTELEGSKQSISDTNSLDNIQKRIVKKLRRFPVGAVPTQAQLDEWTLKINALLTQFREHVSDLILDISYDETGQNKWTFVGALLFVVTVVTTIGYGNIAPVTTEGRVSTMVYGLFGIPLTLVFLNNLGGYMAQFIRFFYDRAVCRLCAVKNRGLDEDVKPRVPVFLCITLLCAYLLMGAFIFNIWEGWSYIDSVYFCFVTLTTIGFGDLVPGYRSNDQDPKETVRKQTTCMFYVLIGLALVATCFELMKASVADIFRCFGDIFGCRKKKIKGSEADKAAFMCAVKIELLSRIQEEARLGSSESFQIVDRLKQGVARKKMSYRNIRFAGGKRAPFYSLDTSVLQ